MQQPPPLAATRTANLIAHERAQRLSQAAGWLLEGTRPRDVVAKASATWSVGKRMAQLYVAAARQQLHSDALHDSHLFAQQFAREERLKALHKTTAVVDDPAVSDARRRAQISYFGKVTRLLADYEKSALQADETHSTEKFMPTPLRPMDLQMELDRLEAEDNLVNQWFAQAEGAAEQGTGGNVPVASVAGSSTTAAPASASAQEKCAAAQSAGDAAPQTQDYEQLAEDNGDCAYCADCALDNNDFTARKENSNVTPPEPPVAAPAQEAPPEFNPTTCQKIVASVQNGGRLHVAAAAAGISRQTLRHWLKLPGAEFQEFRQQVRQAKGKARLQAEKTVHQKDSRYWLSRGPGVKQSPDPNEDSWDNKEAFNKLQRFVLDYLHGMPEAKADFAQKLLDYEAKLVAESRT